MLIVDASKPALAVTDDQLRHMVGHLQSSQPRSHRAPQVMQAPARRAARPMPTSQRLAIAGEGPTTIRGTEDEPAVLPCGWLYGGDGLRKAPPCSLGPRDSGLVEA